MVHSCAIAPSAFLTAVLVLLFKIVHLLGLRLRPGLFIFDCRRITLFTTRYIVTRLYSFIHRSTISARMPINSGRSFNALVNSVFLLFFQRVVFGFSYLRPHGRRHYELSFIWAAAPSFPLTLSRVIFRVEIILNKSEHRACVIIPFRAFSRY